MKLSFLFAFIFGIIFGQMLKDDKTTNDESEE